MLWRDRYGAQCNSWEGEFPRTNDETDGYTGTVAPKRISALAFAVFVRR